MRSLHLFTLLAVLAAGCTTTNQGTMTARAAAAPENHRVWTRPLELGFDLGEDVTGEATVVTILGGLIVVGSEDDAGLLQLLGNLSGIGGDPLVRAASADAAKRHSTDGVYITWSDVQTSSFFPFFKRRTAQVKGKAMRLKVLGEVKQERVDRERYLRSLSSYGQQLAIPAALIP